MTSDEYVDKMAQRRRVLLAVLLVVLTASFPTLVVVRRLRPEWTTSVAPIASVAAPVPSALPPEKGGPVVRDSNPDWDDYDARFKAAQERKAEAFKSCEEEVGVVVMGFGSHVVCLKPNAVIYDIDPMYPQFPRSQTP